MKSTTELLSDRIVLTEGTLDAPRAVVFAAWTDPSKLSRWWGPKGFTNVFELFEPKAQGRWKFVMTGPDGAEYRNVSEFDVVDAPNRFAFRHLTGPLYAADVTFEEDGPSRTKVTWRMTFDNPKFLADYGDVVLNGNRENLEKLAEVLAEG